MLKNKNTAEAVQDVKELNWEESEFPGNMNKFTIHQVLDLAFRKIDKELSEGNPVIGWGIYPGYVNFIFRDGRKACIHI